MIIFIMACYFIAVVNIPYLVLSLYNNKHQLKLLGRGALSLLPPVSATGYKIVVMYVNLVSYCSCLVSWLATRVTRDSFMDN